MKRGPGSALAAVVMMVTIGCTACSGSSQSSPPTAAPTGGPTSSTDSGRPATTAPVTTAPAVPIPRGPAGSLPARWWTWAESIPVARNPIRDRTGADCAVNQPTDVWFLAGTFGGFVTRSCTIPAGRPVYFPVLNTICTVPAGQTVDEETAECTQPVDRANAQLDATALNPMPATSRGEFRFTARQHSLTGFPAGPHYVVVTGEWVGPVRLSVGTHVLLFEGVSGTFETQVEYHLTVSASAGSAA